MTMSQTGRLRNRKDIGRVEFLIDKVMAARSLSSCCAGQEAMLETNRGLEDHDPARDPNPSRTGAA
jgi:hypothetical protein